nr:MAG TPA: hypothetical protein [Caudoviricetes sp.]
MANLKEQEKWEDGVYQIEENDPVLGGENGITNKPAKQLANRTLWLKKFLELLGKKSVPKDLTANSTSTADESGHSHKLPVGSTTQKGIWQATSDTGVDSDGLVLTAKAGKKLAQLIAVVQLALNNYIPLNKRSSSVNSNDENNVATSKAVKTAYDKGIEAKNAADNAQQSAEAANTNANSRVAKSGDTMTDNLSLKQGDYSGLNLYNNDGYYTRLEGNPNNSSSLLTLVYRTPKGENIAVASLPKKMELSHMPRMLCQKMAIVCQGHYHFPVQQIAIGLVVIRGACLLDSPATQLLVTKNVQSDLTTTVVYILADCQTLVNLPPH